MRFTVRFTVATLVAVLALGLFAVPLATEAQEGAKVARVATLWATSRTAVEPFLDAIEEGLRELGWVAGRNLVLEHRFSDGKPERLPILAAEVIAWKPDVAVAPINAPALALKRLTNSMPIVVLFAVDPVGVGLAGSLARPGGNVTGMTGAGSETSAKRLQMLREVAPAARRVGIIWNAAFPGLRDQRKSVDDAAAEFGMTIVEGGVRDPEGFPRAFETLTRERVDALIVLGDNLTFLRRQEIVGAAIRHRWPAIYTNREYCDAGGLACYGVNLRAQFKRGAVFVDKILRGASPATIPIEQPTLYHLVINLGTAKALGVTVPQSLRVRTDHVIE